MGSEIHPPRSGRPEPDTRREDRLAPVRLGSPACGGWSSAESLPAGAIRWGRHVGTVSADSIMAFDGAPPEAGCDLVADTGGPWSEMRRALSDQAPVFSGVAAVQLEMADPQRAAPELHAAMHRGSLFAQGEHRRLVARQIGDGSLSVSVAFRAPAASWPATCGFDPADLADVQRPLLGRDDLFAGWHPARLRLAAALFWLRSRLVTATRVAGRCRASRRADVVAAGAVSAEEVGNRAPRAPVQR